MVPINNFRFAFLAITLLISGSVTAQVDADSIRTKKLGEVVIEDSKLFTIERLPKLQGTYLWSGKKNEVINVQNLDASITDKLPRQIFSKVPGVFVYDMDGTGNQINISTRGLDPHRGWEFNVRKNGVITNSDMYGYPASHFSMPMEAVDRIELVRGTGSLQYGAQFGGMLNYVSKKPDSAVFNYETVNAAGSFNTSSTYHAVSGTIGKVKYHAYYNKRTSDGYRKNSHSDFDAQSIVLMYAPSKHLDLRVELARSKFAYQIPGPITDSMFYADPRQSSRSRNYYSPEIYVPSVTLEWEISNRTQLSWVVSAILGERNSVQFTAPANIADGIDASTLQHVARVVDVDHYNSYTSELRLLHQYVIGNVRSAFSGGFQMFNNDLHRQQLGKGTTGTDFDLTLTDGVWGRDLHFKSKNLAVFAENSFWLTPALVVTPGMRMETGHSDMSGTITYYDSGELPRAIEHRFPLLGINAEYTSRTGNSVYAGWSQAYRPVIFQDIIPATVYDRSDKNPKDADGYNLEVGYRGMTRNLRWDLGAFSLLYNNRPGTLAGDATGNGNYYILRTTIGNSVTNGLELFVEYALLQRKRYSLNVFTSTALFHSAYREAQVRSGNDNVNVSGNKVESVPGIITRNGINFRYDDFSTSFLYSYTGESYADPLNTVSPSPSGSVGPVPAYGILDFNASLRVFSKVLLRFNVSNVTDRQYFTKRPEFYPGPGVWSSDGRSINCSVAFKI